MYGWVVRCCQQESCEHVSSQHDIGCYVCSEHGAPIGQALRYKSKAGSHVLAVTRLRPLVYCPRCETPLQPHQLCLSPLSPAPAQGNPCEWATGPQYCFCLSHLDTCSSAGLGITCVCSNSGCRRVVLELWWLQSSLQQHLLSFQS